MRKSLYDILQVSREADADVIEAAYERLRERYGEPLDESGRLALMATREAYETLRNPARRAAYDRAVAVAQPQLHDRSSETSAFINWWRGQRKSRLVILAALLCVAALSMKYARDKMAVPQQKDVTATQAMRAEIEQAGGSSKMGPGLPPANERALPGQAGWSVDGSTRCWVWNGKPQPNETVRWSGMCGSDARATGHGVVEWRQEGKITSRYEGEMRGGTRHGWGIFVLRAQSLVHCLDYVCIRITTYLENVIERFTHPRSPG